MLNLLHPAHLHISAEYAEPEVLRVGRPVPGALQEPYLLGHDDRDLPTVQDQRIDTEYNGWWACLVPAEIVRAIGYPLPLFFQWDDIEYGYRAAPTASRPSRCPAPASGTPTSGGRTGTSGTGTSTCATA